MIRSSTDPRWLDVALANFDAVLVDHAHCEKKAAATAMALVSTCPERTEMVRRLSAVAIEELRHFRAVHEWIQRRGLVLTRDTGDAYAEALLRLVRQGGAADTRLVDRLLVAALIEARSHERLELLSGALTDPELREFYAGLARAERGHAQLFVNLAERVGEPDTHARLEELAKREAEILAAHPVQARVH